MFMVLLQGGRISWLNWKCKPKQKCAIWSVHKSELLTNSNAKAEKANINLLSDFQMIHLSSVLIIG